MTAVRSVDSFKYGTRLFAYLFVILLVGGGLLGLGALIIENANTSLSSGITGIPDKTELAGGAVLALLGSFVLLSGLFGIVHKLVADGVEAGRAGDGATATTAAVASADPDTSGTDDATPATTGPSPGEQAARDHGDAQTVPSEATAEPPETPEPPEPEPPAEPESPPESTSADAESPDPSTAATAGGDDSTDEPASESSVESEPPEDPRPPEPDPQMSESTAADPTDSNESAPSPSAEDDRSATERAIDEGFGTRDESRDSADEPSPTEPVGTADEPDVSESESGGFETHESVGDSDPRRDGPDTATESSESMDDRSDQSPPEPSPEEIAFGTTPDEDDDGEEEGGDDDDDEETADVDDDSDDDGESGSLDPFEELDEESSSVEPAGNSSAGDPLADPTDDE